MLEIFDQNPGSRVFHVDKECYVLYLGSHWEDYKPFLRIGTSRDLPAGLPPIVSSIVVPDALTGNPLDEPASLSGDATAGTHYVGDMDTVSRLKEFLHQETIPVEAIVSADHEEDDARHVFVYYYSDGNVKVKFKKHELFDLRRRERSDLHFTAQAQSIKNDYGRNPLKYPNDQYQGTGFAVVAGTPYLVSRGELAGLRLGRDYFAELAAAGIDPDRLTTVHTGDVDEALIRFFKRSRAKGKTLRVASSSPERIDAAAKLFLKNSLPELKVHALEGLGGSFDFHRFTVTHTAGNFDAALEGLPGPITFLGPRGKAGAGSSIVVDPASSTVRIGQKGAAYPLLDGALYRLADLALTRTLIGERYLPEKNYPFRDLLSTPENTLISQIEFFFNELLAGRDTAKVIRTIRGLEPVRNAGRSNPSSVLQLVVHNTREYLRFLKLSEPEAARGGEALDAALEKLAVAPATCPVWLPAVGELSYYKEAPFLFFHIAARITADRMAHAGKLATAMLAQPVIADYESERNRLSDLIAGLANPEQMEEARLRRIAEAKKKAAPKDVAEEAAKADEAPSGEAAAAGAASRQPARAVKTGGTQGRKAAKGRSAGRSAARWLVPAAIVVVLLAALLILLATGTIPNPWFGREPIAVDGPDGTVASGDGTRGDGTQDTGTQGTGTQGDGTQGDGTQGDGTQRDGTTDAATQGDGTAGGATRVDATQGDATQGDGTTDGSAADGTSGSPDGDGVTLPQGWPEETLPAVRALQDIPGVVITDERVIGPGGIEITVRDIILLVNLIATSNGYAPMHVIDPERPDPDWIYPGNVFELPNTSRYTVVRETPSGDITVRYMIARLQQDLAAYQGLVDEHERDDTTDARRTAIQTGLRELGEKSHSENFTRMVAEKIASWSE